jgi:heme-binding NEAT domain protein
LVHNPHHHHHHYKIDVPEDDEVKKPVKKTDKKTDKKADKSPKPMSPSSPTKDALASMRVCDGIEMYKYIYTFHVRVHMYI